MNPSKKNYWPEFLVLLFLLIFGVAILRIMQNYKDQATINKTPEISRPVQLLPLSADTLTLGTGPLAIGSRLELTLIAFDKSTPTVHQYWDLKVKEFLGTNGPVAAYQTTEIKTIVLEVPEEYVLEIQILIANPDLKKNVTYRILTNADLSIPTATPTIASPNS